jgi:hypothetical protein
MIRLLQPVLVVILPWHYVGGLGCHWIVSGLNMIHWVLLLILNHLLVVEGIDFIFFSILTIFECITTLKSTTSMALWQLLPTWLKLGLTLLVSLPLLRVLIIRLSALNICPCTHPFSQVVRAQLSS